MKKRFLCLLIFILFLTITGCSNEKESALNVEQIKSGHLNACSNYTIEELINNYMEDPKWSTEKSDKGYKVYNVTGKAFYNNIKSDILIQFAIEKDTIIVKDFKVNKTSKDDSLYLSLITSMCNNTKNHESNIGIEAPEEIDNIIGYDYKLMSNNTEYFKDLYSELKEILNKKDTIDFDKEYAKIVSKLFVADFYDLDSKYDKNNVGGIQFIHKDYRETFKEKAVNTIYDKISNYENGVRNQELPSVKMVNIKSIETQDKFDDLNAYKITLTIDYAKNLGYQTSCTLYLVHNDGKLEVAEIY